ncbi:DinB family protein [Ekhidna sp. To15]|uniref:DinB family protein n=1 Tax=Ekhidna sp. To15 TaxID=3395267 RepID=UPI003F51DD60
MKFICSLLFFATIYTVSGQGNPDDFYYEIPDVPEKYSEGTVAARVVDGLGFRYYWATEGLRPADLAFRPSEEARTIEETIDHVVVLTQILLEAVNERPFAGIELGGMTYEEKRSLTLENIRKSSVKLKSSFAEDLERYDMIFSSGSEFPFWNLLNGPIADAINHVGQIISIRRTNGNPYNQNISVLSGKVKN